MLHVGKDTQAKRGLKTAAQLVTNRQGSFQLCRSVLQVRHCVCALPGKSSGASVLSLQNPGTTVHLQLTRESVQNFSP